MSKWNDQTIIHSVVVYHFDKLIRNGNYTQIGGEREEGTHEHRLKRTGWLAKRVEESEREARHS